MRHDDSTGTKLVIDRDHLMIMNAGRSFWHEERTLYDDGATRVLQIFVRPHTIDLEPKLQFRELEPAEPNTWRLLFGPEDSDAPTHLRNSIYFHDVRLMAESEIDLPRHEDWDAYFYVYGGRVEARNETFGEGETGLLVRDRDFRLRALEDSRVAFLVDRDPIVEREGTIGR